MQCREFQEVSESYLNDELLVETNHQILRHLDHCRECRVDFAHRQRLRRALSTAGKNADEFRISSEFSRSMSAELKAEALKVGLFEAVWQRKLVLVPVLSMLVLIASFGFLMWDRPASNAFVVQVLTDLAHLAVGSHKDCALEKLGLWETLASSSSPEKQHLEDVLAVPLRASYSENVEVLSVHECDFDGTRFKHVVLRDQDSIISLIIDENTKMLRDSVDSAIVINSEGGMQVASFVAQQKPMFVVSNLSEDDNLKIARVVSKSY